MQNKVTGINAYRKLLHGPSTWSLNCETCLSLRQLAGKACIFHIFKNFKLSLQLNKLTHAYAEPGTKRR